MAYREAPSVVARDVACFFCGSVIDGMSCTSCMAELLRARGPAPTTCRRCGGALSRKGAGFACAGCGGVHLMGDDWDRIVDVLRAGGSPDVATLVPPPPGTPKPDLLKAMTCACCGAPMERAPFGARSGVIVDVCPRHGIWLDAGEIVPVLEFVRRLWRDNAGKILTPDEQRDAEAVRAYHKLKNELDKRAADEREERDELIRKYGVT